MKRSFIVAGAAAVIAAVSVASLGLLSARTSSAAVAGRRSGFLLQIGRAHV